MTQHYHAMEANSGLIPSDIAVMEKTSPFLSVKGLAALTSVFLVVFVLARALDALDLGRDGMLLSVSVSLLLGGLVMQAIVRAPQILTEYKVVGFFSAALVASVSISLWMHVSLYGWRL